MLRINLLRVAAVAAVFVVGVFAQKPDTAWYNATDVVFEIATADQLAGLAQIVNSANSAGTSGDTFEGKTIILTNDIDLSAYGSGYNRNEGWIPIGGTTMFGGVFDGNGKIISGLYINNSSRDRCGLFGNAMPIATIKNIGIVGGNITGGSLVGGVTGVARGNITNCYFTGEIRGKQEVGGVVGVMWSDTLTNCYSAGVISGSGGNNASSVGGIVGTVSGRVVVANCYSTAAVSNFNNQEGGSYVGGCSGNSF